MYKVRKLVDFNKFILVGPRKSTVVDYSIYNPEIPGSEDRARGEMETRCDQMNKCFNRTYTSVTNC